MGLPVKPVVLAVNTPICATCLFRRRFNKNILTPNAAAPATAPPMIGPKLAAELPPEAASDVLELLVVVLVLIAGVNVEETVDDDDAEKLLVGVVDELVKKDEVELVDEALLDAPVVGVLVVVNGRELVDDELVVGVVNVDVVGIALVTLNRKGIIQVERLP